jgi:hypothetical protein
MNKKIITILIVITVLAAGGSGFYIGIKKPIPVIQSFFEKINPFKSKVVQVSEPLPPVSEEQSSLPPIFPEEPLEKLTKPITEVEVPSTQPSSPAVEKPLTLTEIEAQVNEIAKKVEILKIEVAKYVLEKQIEQLKFAQIQEQINETQKKASAISQEVAKFVAEKAAQQVAGITNEIPYTGGPIQE